MSVATGIAPGELLELDGDLFDELVEAVDERWTPELELAAETVELSSALLVAYLQAHSRKRVRLEPVTVPRPAWTEGTSSTSTSSAAPARVSVLELAELAGKSIEPPTEAPSG